jgi:NAD(P)-dependent dehydrogenase (short-subunit alcohol dehydrogenase family)
VRRLEKICHGKNSFGHWRGRWARSIGGGQAGRGRLETPPDQSGGRALDPQHEAVAAAKAGVEGLVRSAAATYATHGIRINAVAPGIMDTPAAAAILGSAMGRDAAARQYPLPGIGTASELAELMVWLLSDKAARVTGQVWSMDAGFSTIRPLVR